MNEDRPALSVTQLLHTESTFQRCIDYVYCDCEECKLESCVLYTKAVAHLPLR